MRDGVAEMRLLRARRRHRDAYAGAVDLVDARD
jgi:hypothetical protein